MTFRLPDPLVGDPQTQRNFEAVASALGLLRAFITFGEGAPTHTPDGPQVYFEVDGPGVHVFNGSWTAR